jgi:acetyl-CoA carboxylase carboxyl transferase subunit alpha
VYSVIPPEGCAAILWRDAKRKVDAANALKLTAPDLLRLGIIDTIVPEPTGGAHMNHEIAAATLDAALREALREVCVTTGEPRLDARYRKWRAMGSVGIQET